MGAPSAAENGADVGGAEYSGDAEDLTWEEPLEGSGRAMDVEGPAGIAPMVETNWAAWVASSGEIKAMEAGECSAPSGEAEALARSKLTTGEWVIEGDGPARAEGSEEEEGPA